MLESKRRAKLKKLEERRKRKAKSTKPVTKVPEIDPERFYIKSEVARYKYFGYGPTALNEKIENGEVPMPQTQSDSGTRVGWYGWEIIAHREMRAEKGKLQYQMKLKERQRIKEENKKAEALQRPPPHPKKMRLRPPGKKMA